MKFLIVTCLKETKEDVCKLFKEAQISVFSTTEITGVKTQEKPDLLGAWFAAGDEKYDSLMMFSFTESEIALNGLHLINGYNAARQSDFPIRAFIVPVEQSTYSPKI